MKIYKYELQRLETQLIQMPLDAEILCIKTKGEGIFMWAICEPNNEIVDVKIDMYGTGWDIEKEILNDEYLDTVQDGDYVWHFFMDTSDYE